MKLDELFKQALPDEDMRTVNVPHWECRVQVSKASQYAKMRVAGICGSSTLAGEQAVLMTIHLLSYTVRADSGQEFNSERGRELLAELASDHPDQFKPLVDAAADLNPWMTAEVAIEEFEQDEIEDAKKNTMTRGISSDSRSPNGSAIPTPIT